MDNLNPQNFEGGNVQFDPTPSNFSNQFSSNNEGNNSALHFFLYLGNFFSLIFVASGVGAILYQMINKMFPDKTSSYSYMGMFSESAIKFGLASIIIATPIFFILSYIINKYLFEGKISESSKVRKWTTYIVLFVAFAVFLGDLVSLVYGWLGGGMAARFIFKVLVVLFISGSVLGYYFWDMQRKNIIGRIFPENKVIGLLCSVIILVIFVSSFFVVDSPSLARDKKMDSAIITKMTNYKYSIDSYYSKNKTLPKSLNELDSLNVFSADGSRKEENISYKPTGVYTYQLCADFKTSNLEDSKGGTLYQEKEWKHGKGNKCFDVEISQYSRDNANKIQPQQNVPQPQPAYFQEPQAQPANTGVNSNQASINQPVGISFTVKDKNGKLLEGITCAVKGDRGTNKMVPEVSQKTNSQGQCSFKDLDSTVPYLVRVYWTADQSRVSDISLSWIPAGTTITREVIKPENM